MIYYTTDNLAASVELDNVPDAGYAALYEDLSERLKQRRYHVVHYFAVPDGEALRFYLLLAGDYEPRDVVELVKNCFCFVRDFRGEVPGASARDCGNYLDMNLPMANYWGAKYAALLENIDDARLVYLE